MKALDIWPSLASEKVRFKQMLLVLFCLALLTKALGLISKSQQRRKRLKNRFKAHAYKIMGSIMLQFIFCKVNLTRSTLY